MFLLVDETSSSPSESRLRRAWGARGQKNSISEFFNSAEVSYTLIATATVDGFHLASTRIVERKTDKDDTDETRGTVDANRFVLWVQEALVPNLGAYPNPRSVVIMDNASIHKDERVKELIESVGARLIYTAPYSPDLMPIEFAFHELKAYMRRKNAARRINWAPAVDPGDLLLGALKCVTPEHMVGYFRKVGFFRGLPAPPLSSAQQFEEDLFLSALELLVVLGPSPAAAYRLRSSLFLSYLYVFNIYSA